MSLKDYTRKDIVEIRKYLVSLIEKVDTKGVWTDRNESDLGMVILELIAGVADMLNFNIDKQALENYLPTVTQRKNMKRILALVGYEMKGKTSARCEATFNITEALDIDLDIPKYFQVCYTRPEGNIYYATEESCKIVAGTYGTLAHLIQGIVVNVNLTVNDLIRNQTVTIRDKDVAEGSVILYVDGEEWERVDDVLFDEEFGTKYSVHLNNEDQTYLEFGYHWRDYLPADYRKPVVIKYLRSAGGSGAVREDLITTIVDHLIIDDVDYTKKLSVRNTEDASGGSEVEDMELARVKAPHLVRTRKTVTTLQDYEYFAENCPGVYTAKAIDWTIQNSLYIGVPYLIDLYIVPNDDETYFASNGLCNDVYNEIAPYKWSSIQLNVKSAEIYDIDLKVNVYTSSSEARYAEIKKASEDVYKDHFDKKNHKFQEIFTKGKLETILLNHSEIGLDYVEVIEPETTIHLNEMQFPRLGKLEINVVDTEDFKG